MDSDRYRRDNFKVAVEPERYSEGEVLVKTTHNGYQWSCLGSLNEDELGQLIRTLINYTKNPKVKE